MKKTLLLLFILLSNSSIIYSQDITFGIKGGVNFATIGDLLHKPSTGESGVSPTEIFTYSPNSEMGQSFGAYFRINLNEFYFQPEVGYTSLNSNYELAFETSQWTQTNIDISLLFGYNVFYPISLYIGPGVSLISDRQIEGIQNTSYVDPWTFEKSNLNLNLGLNVSINRFSLDVRYSYGLTKVEGQNIDMIKTTYGTNLATLLEYNPSQIILSLQIDLFKFGGEKKKRGFKSDWRNHKNL